MGETVLSQIVAHSIRGLHRGNVRQFNSLDFLLPWFGLFSGGGIIFGHPYVQGNPFLQAEPKCGWGGQPQGTSHAGAMHRPESKQKTYIKGTKKRWRVCPETIEKSGLVGLTTCLRNQRSEVQLLSGAPFLPG